MTTFSQDVTDAINAMHIADLGPAPVLVTRTRDATDELSASYEFKFGEYHIYAEAPDYGRFARELLAGGFAATALDPMFDDVRRQLAALQAALQDE